MSTNNEQNINDKQHEKVIILPCSCIALHSHSYTCNAFTHLHLHFTHTCTCNSLTHLHLQCTHTHALHLHFTHTPAFAMHSHTCTALHLHTCTCNAHTHLHLHCFSTPSTCTWLHIAQITKRKPYFTDLAMGYGRHQNHITAQKNPNTK